MNVKTPYQPLITIITVTFNAANDLEKTIKSVIEQSYNNLEYIIIDGKSTDGSRNVIRKYEDRVDFWISEADEGVYFAMNKGIELANGDWVNFMNAGDCFSSSETLSYIAQMTAYHPSAVILYGDHEVRKKRGHEVVTAGPTRDLWKGSQFSHQSAFIKSSYHKANPYNTCRHISADFEFFYLAHKDSINIIYVPTVLSSVLAYGISDTNRIDAIIEWWSIIDKSDKRNIYFIFRILIELLKTRVKKVLGYG